MNWLRAGLALRREGVAVFDRRVLFFRSRNSAGGRTSTRCVWSTRTCPAAAAAACPPPTRTSERAAPGPWLGPALPAPPTGSPPRLPPPSKPLCSPRSPWHVGAAREKAPLSFCCSSLTGWELASLSDGLEARAVGSLAEGGGSLATNKVSSSSPDFSDLFSSRPGPLEAHVLGRAASPGGDSLRGRVHLRGQGRRDGQPQRQAAGKRSQQNIPESWLGMKLLSLTQETGGVSGRRRSPRKERGRGDPERHR